MGLLDLLPGKHATFNLTVTIDDIQNVPLVYGSLSVGWKFRKYTSKETELHEAHPPTPPSSSENQTDDPDGLQRIVTLQKMISLTQPEAEAEGVSSDQNSTPSLHASEYDDEDDGSSSSSSENENRSSVNVSASSLYGRSEKPEGKRQGKLLGWKSRTKNLRNALLSNTTTAPVAKHRSTNDGDKSPPGSTSVRSSPSASSSHLDSNPSETRDESGSSATGTSSNKPLISSRSRGETAKVPIVDHACSWSQKIRGGVQISVSRDGELGKRWMKFVVLQHLPPPDASLRAEKDILLGQLELNLAEYAGFGPVTRRYLLDEGKTNATLKVCIELEQVGGESEWNPTLITKGQILGAGIESLVAQDERSLSGTPVMSSANLNRLCVESRPALSRKSSDHSHSHPRPSSLSTSAKPGPGPSTPPHRLPSPSHNSSHHTHLFSSTPLGSSTNLHTLGTTLQHHLLPHSKANSSSSSSSVAGHRKSFNSSRPRPPASSSPLPETEPRIQGRPTIEPPPNELSRRQDRAGRAAGFLVPSRTEDIIEALFNPFESATLGPFTIPYASGVARKPSSEGVGKDGPGRGGERSVVS